jgi:FkbM family methyltransferase
MQTHSQHGEDLAIDALLQGDYAPHVVDVGANDGISWSNSYAFVHKGFAALLIEPMQRFADYCRVLHQGNPKVSVEQVAILPTAGRTRFFINNDQERDLLAMASSVRREIIDSSDVTEVEVQTYPLTFLLEKHQVPSNYAILNVDAEGVDLEVLQSAGLHQYRPAIICVEYGTNEANIHDYLSGCDYLFRQKLGPNGIYTRLA